MRNAETVLAAYIECALWASIDNADDSGGEPLDANYGPEDIAPESLERMREDVADFILVSEPYASAWDDSQLGHDFWLTRNRHGAGFWDRGRANGDKLTELAHICGGSDLYVGDDNRLYVSP